MPTYEYSCKSCNEVIDVYQSMLDAPLTNCPQCGQAGVKRLIGRGSGIIFKGSGFYETDYKRSAEPKQESSESSSGGETNTSEKESASPSKSSSSNAAKSPDSASASSS